MCRWTMHCVTCQYSCVYRYTMRVPPSARRRTCRSGRAVQVGPMKPMLKAPGTKRLKLKYDESPSNFAFKFNLRRYTVVRGAGARPHALHPVQGRGVLRGASPSTLRNWGVECESSEFRTYARHLADPFQCLLELL